MYDSSNLFNVSGGIPLAAIEDLADLVEWIEGVLDTVKSGEIGDFRELFYDFQNGKKNKTFRPDVYRDEDSGEWWAFAESLQLTRDGEALDFFAHVARGDAGDAAIMAVQFATLLVLLAKAMGLQPRKVEFKIVDFEGAPEPYGEFVQITLNEGIAGWGWGTIIEATADDFDVTPLGVSAAC